MGKKKVTLSIEAKIYDEFQKYCEENAIMLSKKLELVMKELTKGKKKFVMLFFMGLMLLQFASGATIFSDDFEDGDTVGWTIGGTGNLWVNSNTDPQGGSRHVQANQPGTTEPATTMERIISTSNYQNITLRYYRKLVGIDAADEFQVEYNTGAEWNILESTGGSSANDGSYVYQEFNLSSLANNNSNFQIKFECTAGAVSEFCRIDSITVLGNLIDTSPPTFGGYVESPSNGTQYALGAMYRFNTTITESQMARAGIEFNGINYTLTNLSNVYMFNISNLPAGSYSYYWWSNDTTGSYNTSGIKYYTVSKIQSSVNLSFNVSSPITFGSAVNVTCATNNFEGSLRLYRNGADVTSNELSKGVVLGSGTYNYVCNVTASQNYSYAVNSSTFVVNNASGNVNLSLNSNSGNLTIQYPQQTNISAATLYGNVILYLDGVDITGGNGLDVTRGSGFYNVTAFSTGDQNHSSASVSYYMNITKANGNVTLLLNGVGSDLSLQYPQHINASGSTTQGTIVLYREGVDVTSAENGRNVTLGVGYYNFTSVSSGNQNYSSAILTRFVNVTKGNITISLLLNGNSGNLSINYLQSLNVSANLNGGSLSLYKDGVDYNAQNSLNAILGAGYYQFKANATGNANYSDNQEGLIFYANISKINPNSSMSISINPSENVSYGTATLATATESVSGDGDLNYGFYRNGVLIAGSSPWAELSAQTLGAGSYNYFFNTSGGANYTSGEFIKTLTVNRASNDVTLLLNGVAANLTLQNPQQLNATAISISGVLNLFRNGSIVNLENGLNVTLPEGFYEYFVNSSGNQNYSENSSGVRFYVNVTPAPDTTAPSVLIFSPSEGATFGINTSLSLNFSATDSNLQSCWYNLDGGDNITLISCANTTFNTSEGSHTIFVYANDSAGNLGSDSNSFSITIGAPSISVSLPIDGPYLNYDDVTFVYNAIDPDGISSCDLYGDFGGAFEMVERNSSVVSGQQSSFYVEMNEGTYKWGITCNDTLGFRATSPNRTFTIDTTGPNINISEPRGEKNSLSGISLSFNVSDNSLTQCIFNIMKGASFEIANTSVNCSSGTTFSVSSEGNYILNLYVNDSAGNYNLGSSNFSVVLPSPPSVETPSGGSGGGGGGGGGSFPAKENLTEEREANLEIKVDDLILKRGTTANFEVGVVSNDKNFLNRCKLMFDGEIKSWFVNSESKGLTKGEKYVYNVEITAPESAETGSYPLEIRVQCDEGRKDSEMSVTVYRNDFEPELLDYIKEGTKLKVNYKIEEFAGREHDIVISYSLLDFDNLPRYKGATSLVLGAREIKEGVIEFELPKDSFGEFNFETLFSDGVVDVKAYKEVFLPSGTGVTGLVVTDENRRALTKVGIVIAIVAVGLIGLYLYRKIKKKKGITFGRQRRVLLDLEF